MRQFDIHEPEPVRKQYTITEAGNYKKHVKAYLDGYCLFDETLWLDEAQDKGDELVALGYEQGFTEKEIEETRLQYEYKREHRIQPCAEKQNKTSIFKEDTVIGYTLYFTSDGRSWNITPNVYFSAEFLKEKAEQYIRENRIKGYEIVKMTVINNDN